MLLFKVIPPISIVLILYIFYLIYKLKKIEKIFVSLVTLSLFFEMSSNMGYFISFESFDISLNNGISLFALVFAILMILEHKYDRKILFIGGIFFVLSFYGLLLFYAIPFSGNIISNITGWDYFLNGDYVGDDIYRYDVDFSSILGLINLVKWVLFISVISWLSKNRPDFTKKIFEDIFSLSVIIIFYGFLELFFKNVFQINTTTALLCLFGEKTAQFDGSLIRGTTMQKIGLFTETSFYCQSLFYLCFFYLIFISYKKKCNENTLLFKIVFFIALFLLLFTFSFFTIIAVPLILFVFLFLMKRSINMIFGCCFAIIFLLLLLNNASFFNYFDERITRTIQNIGTLGDLQTGFVGLWSSETARLTSIVECFKIFLNCPFWGVGIRITDCHSTVMALLVSMGFVGFTCWMHIIRLCCGSFNIIFFALLLSSFVIGGAGQIFFLSIVILPLGYNKLLCS